MHFLCPLGWRHLLLAGLLLLLGSRPAAAQLFAPTSARAYDFLTVTVIESPYTRESRLLFSPAFQGTTELTLEEVYNLSNDKYRDHLQLNTTLINQSLSDLSVAGWELIDVYTALFSPAPTPTVTRYLLRKAKS